MPKPPKPIALWLAQLLFLMVAGIAVFALANAIWSGRIAYVGAAAVGAAIPVTVGLIIGIQVRRRWAHFGATGAITLLCVAFIWQSLQRGESGGLAGALLGNVLWILLAWRVGFGEPSRAYFAGKPVTPPRSVEES